MRHKAFVLVLLALATPLAAQENFATWPLLKNPFESTGGGGIMIDGYNPVIEGKVCRSDFSAKTPAGEVYNNTVEFDAVDTQGGILCTNGRWRAKDGSSQGTTPFRIFMKDGIVRRAP